MITSYTLIRILPTKDEEVYNTVRVLKEVKELVLTYGEYDLIIKVESETLDELDSFIFNKLRTTKGVEATTTLIEAKPSTLVND